MASPARVRRWPNAIWVAIGLLTVGVGMVSLDRGIRGRFDFSHFYQDACHVWQHGALNPILDSDDPAGRQLPFYLPAVSVAIAPLGALPRVPAAIVWALLQMLAVGYSLAVLVDLVWRRAGQHATPTLVVLLLLTLPVLWEAAKFNQVSFFVLALILAGWRQLSHGSAILAGAALGTALVLKLLPGVFLPWLLLKRQWAAAGSMLIVAAALAFAPCAVFFGPAKTAAYHAEWLRYNRASATGDLNPTLRDHFIDHRNQSVRHVVARWVHPEHPHRMRHQPLHLSSAATTGVAWAILGVMLAALLWKTRHAWQLLSDVRRDAEIATYALGMLVFAPLLRQYYLIWALPALVLLTCWAAGSHNRRRNLGWLGIVVWLIGMLAWVSESARAAGVHLLMLIILGSLLLTGSHARNASSNSAISGRQLKRT